MGIDLNEILHDMEGRLSDIDYIRLKDIPDIELYMDQVTTFMDTHLGSMKRYDDDKVLTKTMINNYAKNNLLPPPVKKKYSKDHMLILTFIYYFKSILSIKDIESLLNPLCDEHFSTTSNVTLSEVYKQVCETAKEQMKSFPKELEGVFASVKESVRNNLNINSENDTYLEYFSIICYLAFDSYMKKFIIEQLIDQMNPPEDKNKKQK
ncbi:MAG: DUF1836 domain-containing protein [Suipraeoptans sp.]